MKEKRKKRKDSLILTLGTPEEKGSTRLSRR